MLSPQPTALLGGGACGNLCSCGHVREGGVRPWPPPVAQVATVYLGSAVHSFPRAMPAFSCTAVLCESPPASFNRTCTRSVFSMEDAILGTSMQLPRQRAALPIRISSSELSRFSRTLNSTRKGAQAPVSLNPLIGDQQRARGGWDLLENAKLPQRLWEGCTDAFNKYS